MAGFNKIIIIGNLGGDPEMRFTPNGNPVANFRVAVSRKWTENEEPKEETEWFTIVTWNRLAETCNQFIQKGSLVCVEGRMQTRNWENDAGETKYRTELMANNVTFLDSKPKEEASEESDVLTPTSSAAQQEESQDNFFGDDEIPL